MKFKRQELCKAVASSRPARAAWIEMQKDKAEEAALEVAARKGRVD